jgi:hypothetical protein
MLPVLLGHVVPPARFAYYFGDGLQIDRVPRTISNSAASPMIYRPPGEKLTAFVELGRITRNDAD